LLPVVGFTTEEELILGWTVATNAPEFLATPLADGRGPTGVVGVFGGAGLLELRGREGRAWANSVGGRIAKTRAEPKRVTENSLEMAIGKLIRLCAALLA